MNSSGNSNIFKSLVELEDLAPFKQFGLEEKKLLEFYLVFREFCAEDEKMLPRDLQRIFK
jgi:hypothetical protein